MKSYNKHTWKTAGLLGLSFLFLGLLLSLGEFRLNQEALARRISPAVLRFHVLADSDRNEDQNVKLEIRSLILDTIQSGLPPCSSKEETISWIRKHTHELTRKADQHLKNKGFFYHSQLQIVHDYFPARSYGEFRFPCGQYDAIRITLGSGQGHNWWCVLYPRFCFTEAVCSEVPPESKEILHQTLNQDDFLALKERRPELKIRFKFLEKITRSLPDHLSPRHNSPSPATDPDSQIPSQPSSDNRKSATQYTVPQTSNHSDTCEGKQPVFSLLL